MRAPDFNNKQTLVNIGTGNDKVPGWGVNKSFERVTIPADGWITIMAHTENHLTQDLADDSNYKQQRIYVYVNDQRVVTSDSSIASLKSHTEDTDSAFIPVKAGDVVKWGYTYADNEVVTPNGYYNSILIVWMGLKD